VKRWCLSGVLCAVWFGASLLYADPIRADQIVNSADSGWYDSGGFHAAANDNYIVGFQGTIQYPSGSPVTYNDYFVFDLSGVTGPVTSAVLSLALHACPNCGFQSADPTETYSLFDVATSIGSLESTHTDATDIFGDLASGMILGSRTISNADNGTTVDILLNSDAVALINASLGGSIAFGGTVTSLDSKSPQVIFGFGGNDPADIRQLRLNPTATVPESSTFVLLMTGCTAIGWLKRRVLPLDGDPLRTRSRAADEPSDG
jgi:hypothetical protein